MYDRVKITNPDGSIQILDKSFSQMVELMQPLTRAQKDAFWAKQEQELPSGRRIFLVREGV